MTESLPTAANPEVPDHCAIKMMLEELERRNYAQTTSNCYIQAIEHFAQHFRRPPDQLTPEQFVLGGARGA